MSYILDALKHSDKERKRGEIPKLDSQQVTLQLVSKRHGRYRLGLWLLLVTGIAGVVGYSLLQSSAPLLNADLSTALEQQTPLVQPLPLKATDPPLRNDDWLLSIPQAEALEGVKISLGQAEAQEAEAIEPAPQRNSKPGVVVPVPPRLVHSAAQDTVEETTAGNVVSEGQGERVDEYAGIPFWRQLPVKTQRSLPEIRFSVHIYSETPAARMVKINGETRREGERIQAGLKLERITRNGVVLNFRGETFWMKAL